MVVLSTQLRVQHVTMWLQCGKGLHGCEGHTPAVVTKVSAEGQTVLAPYHCLFQSASMLKYGKLQDHSKTARRNKTAC